MMQNLTVYIEIIFGNVLVAHNDVANEVEYYIIILHIHDRILF